MRLIDADKLPIDDYKYIHRHTIIIAPTVEAIPIDYIKEQIEMYDGLSDICDDRWGDIYHTFSQVLRGLIVHWRKDVGERK